MAGRRRAGSRPKAHPSTLLGVPGIAAGTWQFTYPANGTPTTTIDGTSGVTYHAKYTFLNTGAYWTVPLVTATLGPDTGPQQQTTYTWQDGVLLGTTYWAYVNGQLVPFGPTHALLPTSETVTQSGRTYSRTYEYDPYDTTHYNHFGQPTHISSTGDYSSSTSLSYHSFSGATYLGDKPASVEVNGISGSAEYADTGFLLSQAARLLTTTFTPDTTGNVLTQTVNTTHVTTFDHSWGVVSSVTGPISAVIRTINPDGSVLTSSKGGHVTTFSYDAAGRLTGVQPPVGNTYTITYANDGTWVTRARGTAWATTCLDGFGRTAFTFDGTGARVDVQYDALGRVVHQTLPYQPVVKV